MGTAVTRSAAEVRAALARADITQTELASLTGRSQNYWSRRLSGAIALDLADLEMVSNATGALISDLVRDPATERAS